MKELRGELVRTYGIENIIATNPKMTELLEIVLRIADSPASVLLTGESGTGKDLIARSLHFQSRRATAPFVPINCAAIPDNLLESELFGHAQGAFTDARVNKTGLFQAANGGTLFLDEISEMPVPIAAQKSISCEICGRRLVRCDEMRELNRTPTTREALVSLVSRCSRSGFGTLWHSPPHRGDYWRLRCLQKRIRRRGVRNDGGARRLAKSRSPRRCSAVGLGEHPGSLCRATDWVLEW